MKRVVYITATLTCLLSLSSCLKDQADVFDKPASARMEAALEHARTVLSSAPHGWWSPYFADLSLGGYVMTFEFTEQQVTARSEVFPGESETTGFSLITDDGPVLSFDVNNKIIHYFSTPSQNEYEAKGGDFEFIILSAEADSLCLKGKRNGNTIKFYPLAEPAADYLKKVADASNNMIMPAGNTTIGGGLVHVALDLNYRLFTIGRKDADAEETQTVPYVITPEGLLLYEPITFNGSTFQHLTYTNNGDGTRNLSSGDLVFIAEPTPEGYTLFNDYVGKYTMRFGSRSFDVELEPVPAGTSMTQKLLVKGLSEEYNLVMDYDKNLGALKLQFQYLTSNEDNAEDPYGVYLLNLDENGYLAYGENDGAVSSWQNKNTLVFNPLSYRSSMFIVLEYHPYDDEYTWHVLSSAKYKIGKSLDRFDVPFTMTKK